jgi:predicted amidophosphoribosyltransferase
MLGFGRVTCLFCGTRVRRREARRAQDASRAAVCSGCWTKWDTSGRKCSACATPVRGMQDVGMFTDRKGLGHADCGGARVLRA